jgi:UMF1 family MFS transporter
MLIVGIITYVIITLFAFFLKTTLHYWILAILVGTSQGGIQALSRSFYSKLIPKENSAEFFGLYNIFGRFAAIVGPLLVGAFTQMFGSSRLGVLSLLILFIIGGIILVRVKEVSYQN